ncbi:MAG TPA: sodium:solute symporter [Planktothrix sp.]
MNSFDFIVLIGSLVGIAIYGVWQTRNQTDLNSYVHGCGQTPWFAIGISVMATQASAITFLSMPGQGYLDGMGFVQLYFGVPLALIIISMFFLPIFRRLNVYTAYEFLEKRFDSKTRLLGAGLFLVQRGLGAGLTIYAPAIVVTSVFGWPLNLTVISCGLLVVVYTVVGGCDAVTLTQKYQMAVIFAGMATATYMLIAKLPPDLNLADTLRLAGGMGKLSAVSFSSSIHQRYTFWSGILGGTFLMLSYFGADQSQVQRYIGGTSLRESRLGLLFNAVFKIPMQICILALGVLLFVFYQFQQAPLFFDSVSKTSIAQRASAKLVNFENNFNATHVREVQQLRNWLQAEHKGDKIGANASLVAAAMAQQEGETIRTEARKELLSQDTGAKANDTDFIFINFILSQLPHGVIGLLIAAFFAAALSSKAAELNALGTTTSMDFYRLLHRDASDAKYLTVAKWSTAFWGIFAIGFALTAHLSENLIQAVNILGSIFYGVLLGLFVVAFFVKRVGGTAIFWAAIVAQALVFVLYAKLTISYLWYPLIGCAACVALSLLLQAALGKNQKLFKECTS